MKISIIKEIDVETINFEFTCSLPSKTCKCYMIYTCPECAGHGCKNPPNCYGGTIKVDIEAQDLTKVLPREQYNALVQMVKQFQDLI